jgi:predicted RNA-binding protein with PUA-like domain
MNYWLFKTEPDLFSLEDLIAAKDQTTTWDGIRNYQARNFLRDHAKAGDQVLFYHSRCAVPGIVGLAEVCREAYPDASAWEGTSLYFDPKSKPESPTWMMVDVRFIRRFPTPVSLEAMKASPALSGMLVIRKGQRLSIQPVERAHFEEILRMGGLE